MSKWPEFLQSGETARLIPVVADSKKEQRTTSVVLAAMIGVYEFRQTMLGSLGIRVGNRANLHAWTEVTFVEGPKGRDKIAKKDRPDGLLVLETGKKKWTALIEAKVGNAEVGDEQLKEYLKQAKHHKIDAVITITNQFVALPTHHPVKVQKNLTRGIKLFHWSWTYILTQATLLLEGDEIESQDQQFLLEEVVRYLSNDSSGISRFDSMNRKWKDVVGKVKSNAPLNKTSEEVANTVSSWHQEQRDLCLVMSRELGRTVKLRLSRSHRTDPQKRLRDDIDVLVRSKILNCELEIPHAAAVLNVTADLATRTIVCSMHLDAPQDKKRTSARVNWLTRQLSGIEFNDIYIKALRPGRAEETQATLEDILNNPEALSSETTDVVPKSFEVFYMVDLAGKFSGSKVFIEELERAVPHFYEQAGQKLRAWIAPPPKIRRTEKEASDKEKKESKQDEVVKSVGNES
ncbi:MAG: hypothetical protein WD097_01935 [Balneolales bacterium]